MADLRGDLDSTKYSPLEQIDRENFGDLEIAWRWQSADAVLSLTMPDGSRVARRLAADPVDPETGILYVPSGNRYTVKHFRTPEPGEDTTLALLEARGAQAHRPQLPQGLPLFKPPYSRMTAIDMNRGEHRWTYLSGGRQYIALTVGGGRVPELIALALPATDPED